MKNGHRVLGLGKERNSPSSVLRRERPACPLSVPQSWKPKKTLASLDRRKWTKT